MIIISRKSFILPAVAIAVALASCTASGQDPLVEELNSSEHEQPVIRLSEVYGTEWDTFGLACSGVPASVTAEELDIPEDEVPDLEGNETHSAVIYWNDESVEYSLIDNDDVLLCRSNGPLVGTLAVETIQFSPGTDGQWLAGPALAAP